MTGSLAAAALLVGGTFVIVAGLATTWIGAPLALGALAVIVGWPLAVRNGRRNDLRRYEQEFGERCEACAQVAPAADEEFDATLKALVREAIEDVPGEFRERISNLAVVIEQEPPPGQPWLAFYRGVALPHQSVFQPWSHPHTVTIYSGPFRRHWGGDPDALRREVRRVVRHELAHYFGISDRRLVEIGRY